MKRSELKAIIKECIVEILEEGLLAAPGESRVVESRSPRPTRKSRPRLPDQPPVNMARRLAELKSYAGAVDTSSERPARANDGGDRLARSVTMDPVLQSVFADTAQTTLMEQASGERSVVGVPGGSIPSQAPATDVDLGLLGDASGIWSQLAFADAKPGTGG